MKNWIATLVALAIVFLILNGALWVFGKTVAPLVWTSPDHRQCQSKGYWYASTSDQPGTIRCSTWRLLPIPGGRGKH